MCPPTNSLATIPSFSARELKACSGAKVHSSHVSRLVKARGGGFGGWKTGLKREEFATGFSCASLLFCALCFCQFVICVVQLIAEINLSNATLPHCSIVAAECCYLCVFQLIDSLETDWGTNWDSRPLLGYC